MLHQLLPFVSYGPCQGLHPAHEGPPEEEVDNPRYHRWIYIAVPRETMSIPTILKDSTARPRVCGGKGAGTGTALGGAEPPTPRSTARPPAGGRGDRRSGRFHGLAERLLPLRPRSAEGRPLSGSTLSTLLRGLRIAAVPHGFRSSFRDWCGECSSAPREVAEAALAHVVRDKVEAAYARSDLFERRRVLMHDWAEYIHRE